MNSWEEAPQAVSNEQALSAPNLDFQPGFRRWAQRHLTAPSELLRPELGASAGFGGCAAGKTPAAETPVLFIHGNADAAVGSAAEGALGRGWRTPAEALLKRGRTLCGMYAFTWGNAKASSASAQAHDRTSLRRVRQAMEAVLAYTGAAKVDVVAHSMGVTLARAAIVGGTFTDAQGSFDLGSSLGARVDHFVGIAGANRGLASCWGAAWLPTCSRTNGLFPGTLGPADRSAFLRALDAKQGALASETMSVSSTSDAVLGLGGGWVFGEPTSRLPAETRHCEWAGKTHMELRDSAHLVLLNLGARMAPCGTP